MFPIIIIPMFHAHLHLIIEDPHMYGLSGPIMPIDGTSELFIQSVSRLVDITAGGDFLGLCNQKSLYKHLSDFGRLRSYDRLKLRIEGNDY